MARMIMLTEEEVERMEKQRELQERAQRAVDPNALYNQRMKAAHEAAMERRRGRILANPSAETDTTLRHQVLRDEESRLAREHEMKTQAAELATREEEARQKRLGMENQGASAAGRKADADTFVAQIQAGGADRQREHELAMLKQQQEFGGLQNDAERKNKLEIANLQGQSAVGAARAQAEARAADIAAKNALEQGKIDARNHATDTRAATEADKELGKRLRAFLSQRTSSGMSTLTPEEKAQFAKLAEKAGL